MNERSSHTMLGTALVVSAALGLAACGGAADATFDASRPTTVPRRQTPSTTLAAVASTTSSTSTTVPTLAAPAVRSVAPPPAGAPRSPRPVDTTTRPPANACGHASSNWVVVTRPACLEPGAPFVPDPVVEMPLELRSSPVDGTPEFRCVSSYTVSSSDGRSFNRTFEGPWVPTVGFTPGGTTVTSDPDLGGFTDGSFIRFAWEMVPRQGGLPPTKGCHVSVLKRDLYYI